jgi:hypothetical protein
MIDIGHRDGVTDSGVWINDLFFEARPFLLRRSDGGRQDQHAETE